MIFFLVASEHILAVSSSFLEIAFFTPKSYPRKRRRKDWKKPLRLI